MQILLNRPRSPAIRTWFCLLLLTFTAPVHAQVDVDSLLNGEPAAAEDGAERVIDTDTTPADDDRIQRRLSGIYSELEPLSGITVSVSNGVITLSGQVDGSAAAERARNLAGQIDSVVDVVDRIEVQADLDRRVDNTLARISALAMQAWTALPSLLLALLLAALFWWLGGWMSRRHRLYDWLAPNPFIASLLAGVLRILVVLLGLVLALMLLDATSLITTVLGAAGIVGLALGFAVRDSVENFIASVLLSLRQPFEARDLVQVGEFSGNVARLTSRATVLVDPDGNHVRIPNAMVYKSVIINYTRNPHRRIELRLDLDNRIDLGAAQAMALEALSELRSLLHKPLPMVVVDTLDQSRAQLLAYAWIDQREHDLLKVRSEAMKAILARLSRAGVPMPEPAYRVRLLGGSPWLDSSGDSASTSSAGASADQAEPAATRSVAESTLQANVVQSAADTRAQHDVTGVLEEEINAPDAQNLLQERTAVE